MICDQIAEFFGGLSGMLLVKVADLTVLMLIVFAFADSPRRKRRINQREDRKSPLQ